MQEFKKLLVIREKSRIPAVVLVVIFVIILIAYAILFPPVPWRSQVLAQNRAKWESQNITHYRMSLVTPLETIYYDWVPLTVEVKDGVVISVINAHGKTVVPYLLGLKNLSPEEPTIPGLFAFIDREYRENPPEINVTYDPTFGFPATIYIDPYTEPCCAEFTITVSDFKVLP